MKIIKLQPIHIPRIEELERLCFSVPWSKVMIESELNCPIGYYLGCQEDSCLLGYAGMQVILDEGYISNIAVDPVHRRRGIGQKLLEALIQYARERELSFLTLEVRKSNATAQNLYKKLGFEIAGIRINHYIKPIEDALLMTRYLNCEDY